MAVAYLTERLQALAVPQRSPPFPLLVRELRLRPDDLRFPLLLLRGGCCGRGYS